VKRVILMIILLLTGIASAQDRDPLRFRPAEQIALEQLQQEQARLTAKFEAIRADAKDRLRLPKHLDLGADLNAGKWVVLQPETAATHSVAAVRS